MDGRSIRGRRLAWLVLGLGAAGWAWACRGSAPTEDAPATDTRPSSGSPRSTTAVPTVAVSAPARTARAGPTVDEPASNGDAGLAELGALLVRCAEQEGSRSAECDEPLQRLAKKLTLLEVGAVAHPATHVYFCQDLSREGRERDPWRCASAVTQADDTLHTTEFPHEVVELPVAVQLRLVDGRRTAATKLIKVGVGPALELHSGGYVAARRLDVAAQGGLSIADIPESKHVLLFALYRHDAHWVRKHVWVVRRR